MLAGEGLAQRQVQTVPQVLGQQSRVDGGLVGLPDVVQGRAVVCALLHLGRRNGQGDRELRALGQRRDELGVGQHNLVDLAGHEPGLHEVGHLARLVVARLAAEVVVLGDHVVTTLAEILACLAAYCDHLHDNTGGDVGVDGLMGRAHHVHVVGAAQSLVRGAHHVQTRGDLAGLEQRVIRRPGSRQTLQQGLQLGGVGTRGHQPVLRAAQLGRRDHLHGLGDLLRRLDGTDPLVDDLDAGSGHWSTSSDRPR